MTFEPKVIGQTNLILVVLLVKQIHISNMFCRRSFIFLHTDYLRCVNDVYVNNGL